MQHNLRLKEGCRICDVMNGVDPCLILFLLCIIPGYINGKKYRRMPISWLSI